MGHEVGFVMNIVIALLAINLSLEALLGIALIVSWLYPKHRIWPTPKKRYRKYWYIYIFFNTCFYATILGAILLGIVDWNTFFLTHWLRFVFATILIAAGTTILLWAIRTLSIRASWGLKGKLITEGVYGYSRNPQYLSFILLFTGLAVAFNSFYTFTVVILGNLLFILTPFVEEPWLKQEFGKEYEGYCERVSRFIGLRSFRSRKLNTHKV